MTKKYRENIISKIIINIRFKGVPASLINYLIKKKIIFFNFSNYVFFLTSFKINKIFIWIGLNHEILLKLLIFMICISIWPTFHPYHIDTNHIKNENKKWFADQMIRMYLGIFLRKTVKQQFLRMISTREKKATF